MSQQLICDDCGKPIDTSEPYYQLNGSKVQMVDGSLTVVDVPVSLDYHAEHLPSYKIQGEIVEMPGAQPAPPAQEDTPAETPAEPPVEEPEVPGDEVPEQQPA